MQFVSRLAAICVGLAGVATEAMPACASDGTVELPAGDLVFVPDDRIVVEAQEIILGRDVVKTTYAVRNRSTEPLTRVVAWPLPEIDMNVLSGDVVVLASGDPKNFASATVTVDGAQVSLGIEQRAWAFARDVTALLEAGGVSLNPMAGGVAEQLAELPPEKFSELEERGAVYREDNRLMPNWAVRTTAVWRQTFVPGNLSTIGLAFGPVTASGLWGAASLAELKADYCINDDQASAIAARAASTRRGLVTHRLTYTTANSPGWLQPIANARVVIEKASIDTIIASCLDDLKPIGPTLLEAVFRDFHPKVDIRVLFIN